LKKYDVRLYIAVDEDDEFWMNNLNKIHFPSWLSVRFNVYPKKNKLNIPFNQITKYAYQDGADYIVRVNDDSRFTSDSWISIGISKLLSFSPPNVGVVGPTFKGGNTLILTHDMVHRTHLDIFPDYYPEVFDNWWVDDWISSVYGPERTCKILEWQLVHETDSTGRRYGIDISQESLLSTQVKIGSAMIDKYLATMEPSTLSSGLKMKL
jgi:hypothetical protein